MHKGGDAARSPQILLVFKDREEASVWLFRVHSDGTFPTTTLSHWQEADLLHVDPAVLHAFWRYLGR